MVAFLSPLCAVCGALGTTHDVHLKLIGKRELKWTSYYGDQRSQNPRILYETRNEIVHPLKILYETCYNSGSLPSDWRTGNIVAVHKTGNKNDPANYRPISLTCVICKIMESIIRDSIWASKQLASPNMYP